MLCRQSVDVVRTKKSHRTWTKQWNPSVMFSSITHNCIPAIVCSQHTWLVSSNRLCCYRSSHMFPYTDLFAAYHTHLVKLSRFSSHVSTQTVHPSEPHAVYRTHLDLAEPFLLCSLIKNSSSELIVCRISHTHWYGCPFLLFYFITNSSNGLTVCPASHTHCYGCPFLLFYLIADSLNGLTMCPASHRQLKSEPCLMAPPSQTFCTFIDGFFTPSFAIIASHTVSAKGLWS